MSICMQEGIYDEDLAIALIDSSTIEKIASRLLYLSVDYQNALDIFLYSSESTQSNMDKVNEISKELASYRKALQILVGRRRVSTR